MNTGDVGTVESMVDFDELRGRWNALWQGAWPALNLPQCELLDVSGDCLIVQVPIGTLAEITGTRRKMILTAIRRSIGIGVRDVHFVSAEIDSSGSYSLPLEYDDYDEPFPWTAYALLAVSVGWAVGQAVGLVRAVRARR